MRADPVTFSEIYGISRGAAPNSDEEVIDLAKATGGVCTTYEVGELSALAGIAGSYSEHLPIFHLVGAPNMSVQAARALMHHTLGNGEYDLFHRMSSPVVCARAILTPQNVAYETERLIAEALYHRRPVYMAPIPLILAYPSAAYAALSSLQHPIHCILGWLQMASFTGKAKSPGTPKTSVTPMSFNRESTCSITVIGTSSGLSPARGFETGGAL